MARIGKKAWSNYVGTLRKVSGRARTEMLAFIDQYNRALDSGVITLDEYESALIDYAYALATRYGEAAGAAACEMYDATAALQGRVLAPAAPAETATMAETAKTVKGTLKTGNPSIVADAIGRLVKQAGADTTLQNAKRDQAYFAWIPSGDTCAYCLALAGLGWQKAGKLTLEGGHAEHIHANCDCTYAIDFKGDLEIAGYDYNEIQRMILDMTNDEYIAEDLIRMSGHSAKGHDHDALNILRRKFYADNKEVINAQKRSAYAKRMERNSSAAEEINVD